MSGPFSQHGHRVRLEWGSAGVRLLAPLCPVVVIVDVLSFSTAVDVAVGRGASVVPLPWRGGAVPQGAVPRGAVPRGAVPRGAVLAGRRSLSSWSLSPASLAGVPPGLTLALPSPNGATLSAAAASSGATVLAGCLRNAPAVAAAVAGAGTIGVVAAGERWPDGSLRPALEDLLGAGAVVAELVRHGAAPCSPEALAAADAFDAARRRGLARVLAACSSGRELAERGFEQDVLLAAEYGASHAVPRLQDGAFAQDNRVRAGRAAGGGTASTRAVGGAPSRGTDGSSAPSRGTDAGGAAGGGTPGRGEDSR